MVRATSNTIFDVFRLNVYRYYRITCKHSKAFQYSELCRVTIQYRMPDPKEGLPSPCSCQHQDIILAHGVVLDHYLKYW